MSHPDKRLIRAKRTDRCMAWIISSGGLLIIAAVLAILVFITRQALPLFQDPTLRAQAATQAPGATALAVEESGKAFLAVDPVQGITARRTEGGTVLSTLSEGPAHPWRQTRLLPNASALLVQDAAGGIAFGQLGWDKPGGEPDPIHWGPKAQWTASVPAGRPLENLLDARLGESAGLEGGQTLQVLALQGGKVLMGEAPLAEGAAFTWKDLPTEGTATAALLTTDGRHAFVGTREGRIIHLALEGEPTVDATVDNGQPVTALGFALGRISLLVGGEQGSVKAFQVLNRDGSVELQQHHDFQPLHGAIRGFQPSQRDKRFLLWSDQEVAVDFLTTEKRLARMPFSGAVTAALGPRGDAILALGRDGSVGRWHLHAPHPEVSARVLFGKVHYESYSRPEHVWQSSGGSDDFEPKLSLIPLIFGTFKGTLYAMLIALPLAIFGALYTSQFASPRLRNAIKPTIEIMAALPSVVLGFIAGLALAPLLEKAAVHVVLMPLCALLVGALAFPLWTRLPRAFRQGFGEGREVLWMIPVLVTGYLLTMAVAPWFERTFLGGDFRHWLLATKGLVYDQRNALVVGFAMGFAVIPIIFTISEDALSSVPKSLTSASLACGASPWQTAWRVVLPTASPGIFSAIMVGFGRAIGETMIVLMATGNTPVLEWSPFNGMRTMSATIAVEAPEAPEAGTLYRVLFLTALLLFVLTFLLNTLAEVIRQHLRKRYESF